MTTTNKETPDNSPKRSSIGTRVFSFAALCGAVAAIGYVGSTVYHIATDGFVAPIILSPDSDMVIQSKLSMNQLLAEKHRITTTKESIDEELEGAEKAIEQLKTLHEASSRGLEWTTEVTKRQSSAGYQDRRALSSQRAVLEKMISSEEMFAERMKRDMDAGLVSKMDYAREMQSLNQMKLAHIENDRARIVSDVQMSQVALTQRALRGAGDRARFATPEMLMQQDQLVRVQCEMFRLEAERRAKTSERRHIDEELAKIDELLTQLNARPIFRAIAAKTDVAFVPYTQIEGVKAGASVYDCIWGVFACKRVGRVAELLPGEAIVQDPWGSPARGQYAIMELDNSRAATAKTLRVRPSSQSIANPMTPSSERIAKK